MTNLVATITVAIVLQTNWMSECFNGQQIGYVQTNHVGTVVYQNQTNQFVLKTETPSVLVLRPIPTLTTNVAWPGAIYIQNANQ